MLLLITLTQTCTSNNSTARLDSRANAQELLILRGYQVVPVITAYQRSPYINAGNLNVQPYIPFVRAENIDGVSGLK